MTNILDTWDHAVFWLINGAHTPALDTIFFLVTQLGNGWVVAPLLLCIAFFKMPRRRLLAFVLVGVVALTASGQINRAIKTAVKQPRPPACFAAADTSPAVHVVGKKWMRNSFPSGHTNTAFAAAAFLAFSLGGRWHLAFLPALLVGYSRVYMGVHFPLDVVAGGCLGVGVVWLVVRAYQYFEKKGGIVRAQR